MKTLKQKKHFCKPLLLVLILIQSSIFTATAQMPAAITIDPPDATVYDELTLTFDPALACFQSWSLEGLPYIAMHSGVTVYPNTTWQYVIGFNTVGANGQSTYLLPTGDGKYSITYTPADYYGIPAWQTVNQICAVFNNGTDWTQDGRDFDLYTPNCGDFIIPINYGYATPTIDFNLNMNKMIFDGNFNPAQDNVSVEIDDYELLTLFDWDQDGIYANGIYSGLIQGTLYNYNFRINEDQYEDVSRNFLAVGDWQTLDAWWNNEMMGMVTLYLDMWYQIDLGTFDPYSDFVDVAGTMNDWQGSGAMAEIGYGQYATTIYVDQGVFEYKFRINGDWGTSEFPNGGPNRMAWCKGIPLTLNHFYNDYNPDTWPAIFEVDMNNEITSGNFDPEIDFLDLAGTMNDWNGNYFLFDREWTGDGIYTFTALIDKLNPDIEFKFRINGDWSTSEFPMNGPNRSWTVQDTTGGLNNLYQCFYNITEIPYAPYVFNLNILGDLVVGNNVEGIYTYFDPNADTEGESLYQWYRSNYANWSYAVPITGATDSIYTVVDEDFGKYLFFEITPISATGSPSIGDPVHIGSSMVVGITGIDRKDQNSNSSLIAYLYPNPVSTQATLEYTLQDEALVTVYIYNQTGQLIENLSFEKQPPGSHQLTLNLANYQTGIYFYRIIAGIQSKSGKIVIDH